MKQETPQSEFEFEAAYVTVNGARVHYLHAGSGRPTLLIHGLVGSCANWRANIAALAPNSSVYAIDLVNMGKSQRIARLETGLKATAKRIVAFMDALGIAQADIVAHSHGGAVALMLAARHPQRVRRLVLFAPANPYSRSGDWMVRVYSTPWGHIAARLIPYLPARIQRLALGRLYGGADRIVDSCLREYAETLRDSGSLHHVLSIVGCWFAERAKLRRALSGLANKPMLLVWGDRDYTVGLASGERLHRKLRASELIVVPGAGHSVFEDAPEEANQIVLDWLSRHPYAAPQPIPFLAPQPIPTSAPSPISRAVPISIQTSAPLSASRALVPNAIIAAATVVSAKPALLESPSAPVPASAGIAAD